MRVSYLIKPELIELREVPKPSPAEGEVLLKIEAALTCGTDLKAFLRGHPLIPMPGPFGHEFSGTVAEVGRGVKKFKPGDCVMGVHTAPCLHCAYCQKKAYNLCVSLMETKILGAYAEYILIPSQIVKQNLYHKPSNLSFEEAATLEPLSCVVHSIDGLNLKGNKSLIIGCGPIGFLHLLCLKLKGSQVLMTGLEMERLQLAKELGADMVTAPSDLDMALEDFSEGLGVDYVFECTGQLDVWERSIRYVRRGGQIILFGGTKKDLIVTYDTYRLHYDEITLRGSFHFKPKDVKKAFELLYNGLKVGFLITDRFGLTDLSVAFKKLAKGKGLKYAIIP
ncbi:MAG: alcohol dehydrogenase catalytic domain-containing protein [Thermodesulfovibrionales bacterium]|nr:alcohol dehydrogenase catalytic domain-containing protein [Thermodesulfovibrionales bacterium]